METSLKINGDSISIYSVEPSNTSKIVVFLHGGGKTLGKDRFREWQDSLGKESVGSVSFDFSGIGESPGNLLEQTLEKRVNQAECITTWILKRYPKTPFVVYGVSMGGYVALGLINRLPDLFKGLILHAPAAYSKAAHDLYFDSSFTKELHKMNSWRNSLSFKWLENFKGSLFLIVAEKETVIPKDVIKKYESIAREKVRYKYLQVLGAPHSIWNSTTEHATYRKTVYDEFTDYFFKG